MRFARTAFVIMEITIPALMGAAYGVGAGIASILLILCCAFDMALKEAIDEEGKEKQS